MRVPFLPHLSVLLLGSAAVSPAAGQWTAGLEVGADRYWGGSVETSGEHRSFRPYRPTALGMTLERRQSRLAVGLWVQYSEAGMGLVGKGAVGAVEGVFTVVSLAPEVAYRLTRLGPGNQLRLHAGPLLERWGIVDEDSRVRAGAQAAVSLDVPLGGRFEGSVLAGLTLTASPFKSGELPPEYKLQSLWRRRFAVGLQYRL